MTTSTKQHVVDRDIDIFEYVHDSQAEGDKLLFESRLVEDAELRREVEAERTLAMGLKKLHDKQTAPNLQLEKLLQRIEESENRTKRLRVGNRWLIHSAAAGLGALAILVVLYTADLVEPKFSTLSSPQPAGSYVIDDLVQQRRLLRIVLMDDVTHPILREILDSYSLQTLSQLANQPAILLKTDDPVSEDTLLKLQADIRIKQVELVVLDEISN